MASAGQAAFGNRVAAADGSRSSKKRVGGANLPVHPAVLKIFRVDFRQIEAFRICPHVSIKPGQTVHGRAAKRGPKNRLGGIQHTHAIEEILCLSPCFGFREQWRTVLARSRYRGDELYNRLMRDSDGVELDSRTEHADGSRLLLRKSRVEPVNEQISVDEARHVRTARLASSRDRSESWSRASVATACFAPSGAR